MLATHSLPFQWNPDYGKSRGFAAREGAAKDIVWIDVLWVLFHPMNAYDNADGSVTIDCVISKMFERDYSVRW